MQLLQKHRVRLDYNIKTGEKTSVKLVQIAKKREKKKQDGEKINKVKISG